MSLPRLLYVGDVPVESTIAGAVLLYRLFDGYPADRLVICQSDLAAIRAPESRLPGVTYQPFSLGPTRWLYSRFSGYYGAYLLARSRIAVDALAERARVSDAIVTVAHAFSWLTAAKLAKRHGVPLHLVVHDDCLATMGIAPMMRGLVDARFGQVYRSAASRFCISPAMRDHYLRRYGVGSEVLYPSRARDAGTHASPSSRLARRDSPFTVAFAGSLNLGHIGSIEAIASVLGELGGRLEIYGASLGPDLRARLTSSVISFHPFLPSGELSERLRERADVLLMPMSFDAVDAQNMELCFPAKLADYTAMGIPILITGPSYCSAVKWAADNPGAAEVAVTMDALPLALRKLANDAGHRWSLAAEALRIGQTLFGHAQVQQRFLAGLTRTE